MSEAGVALFDIDGTLIDSTYFHALAWWRACRKAGSTIPMARLHRLVGMGGDKVTETLFGRVREEVSDGEAEAYKEFEGEVTRLPGARDLLIHTYESGLQVVLASSARKSQLPAILKTLDAADAVDTVTSADDADETKPAPDIFAVGMERVGARADRAVAIGDTRWDVEAAEHLGIPCIGVLCGGWSQAELLEAGAAEVFQDPADLLRNFDGSLLGRLASSSG
ncbi:MAG TPA: HAD family hydrolase [Chloroflexota bacterium]|nr:HAD family hydrolase [Chloroflexota bacterium]